MKARIIKGIGIIVGIFILAVAVYAYWTEWRFERVRVGAGMDYVEDYQDYYYKAETVQGWLKIVETVWVKKVYFLPGQKEKMLEKIKEDINHSLETLIEEDSDIYYKYEISDNFRVVYLYEASGNIDKQRRDELGPGIIRIEFLIGLYHNIKEGHSVGFGTNELIEIIES